MLTLEAFRKIVDGARGGRSAVAVCREAGLANNTFANLRSGSEPGLIRAARLLDALGMELFVRRKDLESDIRALQFAIEKNRQFGPGLDANVEDSGALARRLCSDFRGWSKVEILDTGVAPDVALGIALAAIRGEEYVAPFVRTEDEGGDHPADDDGERTDADEGE